MPNLTEIHMKIFYCRNYFTKLDWNGPLSRLYPAHWLLKKITFISKRGIKGTQIAKYLAYLDVCRIFLHYPVLMFFFDSESFQRCDNIFPLSLLVFEIISTGGQKVLIFRFEHFYFSSNFNALFSKMLNFMGYWLVIKKLYE